MDEDVVIIHIYTHIYIIYKHVHTVEYYSAIKNEKILPFVTTQMIFESIIPSEIRKTRTNTA